MHEAADARPTTHKILPRAVQWQCAAQRGAAEAEGLVCTVLSFCAKNVTKLPSASLSGSRSANCCGHVSRKCCSLSSAISWRCSSSLSSALSITLHAYLPPGALLIIHQAPPLHRAATCSRRGPARPPARPAHALRPACTKRRCAPYPPANHAPRTSRHAPRATWRRKKLSGRILNTGFGARLTPSPRRQRAAAQACCRAAECPAPCR